MGQKIAMRNLPVADSAQVKIRWRTIGWHTASPSGLEGLQRQLAGRYRIVEVPPGSVAAVYFGLSQIS